MCRTPGGHRRDRVHLLAQRKDGRSSGHTHRIDGVTPQTTSSCPRTHSGALGPSTPTRPPWRSPKACSDWATCLEAWSASLEGRSDGLSRDPKRGEVGCSLVDFPGAGSAGLGRGGQMDGKVEYGERHGMSGFTRPVALNRVSEVVWQCLMQSHFLLYMFRTGRSSTRKGEPQSQPTGPLSRQPVRPWPPPPLSCRWVCVRGRADRVTAPRWPQTSRAASSCRHRRRPAAGTGRMQHCGTPVWVPGVRASVEGEDKFRARKRSPHSPPGPRWDQTGGWSLGASPPAALIIGCTQTAAAACSP